MKLAEAERLFHEALALPTAQERAAYLRNACAGNPTLHEQVERLLAAHEANASLLPTEPGDRTVVVTPTEGPGTVIGRYKLLQQIGEGGMGVVYMAEQEEPVRRRVALKIIKLGMDTKQVVARFEAERQALALMDHPNIAKVLDGGATETGRPYFVMELVRGVPITEYCDKNHLSARQRLDLFIPVCQAIQHAHQKGVIHRDIKPSNVLVTLNDTQALPMVIDFGIAKATSQRLTEKTLFTNFAQMIGTPAYMSPEQAEMNKLDVDTRSDIYSLGVLLYELLTGTTPFSSKELQEAGYSGMQRLIVESDPPKPSTRLATMQQSQRTTVAENRRMELAALTRMFQGDLDWIVMKCLEKDRGRRYETANALAADLQRHLGNEPVAARPPSTAYRLEKAWRRNRLACTAAAAVLVTLLAGISISSWQAAVATRARDRAERAQEGEKQARLRADAEKSAADHNLYVANMTLAQQAWDECNTERLALALSESKDSPYRGFEWFYWQNQIHPEVDTLGGHLAGITATAVSPDGRRIATGDQNGKVKIWDPETAKKEFELTWHRARVASAAFSSDSSKLITGGLDGTARVWEAKTGHALLTLHGLGEGLGSINFVAFIQNDKRLVTCARVDQSEERSSMVVQVWDAEDGSRVSEFVAGERWMQGNTSHDGRRFAALDSNGILRLWELDSGRELLTLATEAHNLCAPALSPDHSVVATTGPGWTVRIWDASTGHELRTLWGHRGKVTCLTFSDDGQRLHSGSADQTVKTWDARSGRELATIKGHRNELSSIGSFPEGRKLLTVAGGTAYVWKNGPGLKLSKFEPNPTELHAPTNTGMMAIQLASGGRLAFIRHAESGEQDLIPASAGQARLWDLVNRQELWSFDCRTNWVSHGVFSPDGRRMALVPSADKIEIIDTASGHKLVALNVQSFVPVLALSPDLHRLVAGCEDGNCRMFDADSGQQLFSSKEVTGQFWSVVFSPDGRHFVTGNGNNICRVWDSASGRPVSTLRGHGHLVRCAAFSPNGRLIVTGSNDKTAKVWDLSSSTELLTLSGHSEGVTSVAFSPDGKRILTGSQDMTTKVWDLDTGRELLSLKGHRGGISGAVFTADGQSIVTAGDDRRFMFWKAASQSQVSAWQEAEVAAKEAVARSKSERFALLERQSSAQQRDSIRHWLTIPPVEQNGTNFFAIERALADRSTPTSNGRAILLTSTNSLWREITLESPSIDFESSENRSFGKRAAYVSCFLRIETTQRILDMHVRGDNAMKVLWEGQELCAIPSALGHEEEVRIPGIQFKQGWNQLLIKFFNNGLSWRTSVRFTDAQGNPVKGLQVSLDPESGKVFEVGKL